MFLVLVLGDDDSHNWALWVLRYVSTPEIVFIFFGYPSSLQ